jgi:hypothetical protein
MDQVAGNALEMKNSIIWDVVSTGRYCNCKILGSTVNVRAYYPESWAKTPYWVQRGQPALIRFPTGFHSRIEIFTEGQIIPSPASTLYQFPESTTPINLITSGCELLQIPNVEQMAVLVKTGKVRIGGDTVDLEAIPANDTNNYYCGMGGACGEVHQVCTITAAPSCVGDYRYDILQVGTDAVVDVLTGTTFRTADVKSSAESGHVVLADVLLHYGMTEIENMDINRTWSYEEHYHLDATWTDRFLDWDELSSTITIEVLDSYGNPINKAGYGWYITLELTAGTGSLESTDGTSTSIVFGYTGKNKNSIDFIYHREQATDNVSPILKAQLEENFIVNRSIYLTLYSSAGTVM